MLYQDIADENRFKRSLTGWAVRLSRCPGKSSEVEFNEVRPHDALGGKTPAEVYRDSERRSLEPLVPNYPPEWITRLVSKAGTISIDGDTVFVSNALIGQVIGLKQEGILRWRARFFGVDLGTIEAAPIANVVGFREDALATPVSPSSGENVNAPVNQDEALNTRAVNA